MANHQQLISAEARIEKHPSFPTDIDAAAQRLVAELQGSNPYVIPRVIEEPKESSLSDGSAWAVAPLEARINPEAEVRLEDVMKVAARFGDIDTLAETAKKLGSGQIAINRLMKYKPDNTVIQAAASEIASQESDPVRRLELMRLLAAYRRRARRDYPLRSKLQWFLTGQ